MRYIKLLSIIVFLHIIIAAVFTEVGAEPVIEITPSSLDFGDVPLCSRGMVGFVITNGGTPDLRIESIEFQEGTSDQYSIIWSPPMPMSVEEWERLNSEGFLVAIGYTPSMLGVATGVLEIKSNDPNHQSTMLLINGIGVEAQTSAYTFTELLPPGWNSARALAVNDDGDIVGYGEDANRDGRLFLYKKGAYIELIPPGWSRTGYLHSDRPMIPLNERGDVIGVGYDSEEGVSKGFIYSDGAYTELLPIDWLSAQPLSLNNNGAVVGDGRDADIELKGFLYSEEIYTELLPPGASNSIAFAINDNGVVAVSDWLEKLFIYSDGQYTELLPPGQNYPSFKDMNENDTILGSAVDDNNTGLRKGFIYSEGAYTELFQPGWLYVSPYAINENGAVIGTGKDENGVRKGFLYHENVYTELLIPGWLYTYPIAINESEAIAGYGYTKSLPMSFVYNRGAYHELLPLCWQAAKAADINNSGIVVGSGADENRVFKGFIATPVLSAEQQIEEILTFFDAALAAGTLEGNGPGNSAEKRLNALRNMLLEAGDLIHDGAYEEACDQLMSAYRKCDGQPQPPDFVTGNARAELASMILQFMTELDCPS